MNIGKKLRLYRKRSGISQFKLELLIGSSAGSISRIEHGINNPTKETLAKLSQALDLSFLEAAELFNIATDGLPKIVNIFTQLNYTRNFDEILQKVVDDIVFELGLSGAFIVLIKGDKIVSQTLTNTKYTKLIYNAIYPKLFNKLNILIEKDSENMMVRTILDNKSYITDNINQIVVPAVTPLVATIIGKVSKMKTAITFPLTGEFGTLGAICFGSHIETDFTLEYPILFEFSKYISSLFTTTKIARSITIINK
ncbi:MAG: helix-turn-helix domain-containing protein [bacterium]